MARETVIKEDSWPGQFSRAGQAEAKDWGYDTLGTDSMSDGSPK